MKRALFMAFVLGAAGCSGDAAAPTTTPGATTTPQVVTTTELTTTPTPTTTEPPPTFNDVGEALRYLFEFNPVTGSAAGVAAALQVVGGHRHGLPLPVWIASGTNEVRAAVIDALAEPRTWNTQILTAMLIYGQPAGSLDQPLRWESAQEVALLSARDSASTEYGDRAEIALALQERLLDREIRACFDRGCEWAGTWYDVPEVISLVEGEASGDLFSGTVWVSSDTGETSPAPITMQQRLGRWVPIEGFLAEDVPPVLVIESPTDGVIIEDPFVAISGFSDNGTTVTIDDETFEVLDGLFWEIGVDLTPGRNDLLVTSRDAEGLVSVVPLTVFYEPDAIRQLAFLASLADTQVGADYAELLFGAEADAAAVAAGEIAEGESVPNGFYIANPEPTVESIPTAPTPNVLLWDADVVQQRVGFDEFTEMFSGRLDRSQWYGGDPTLAPFWLLIVDGTVVQFEQQYIP